MGAEDKAECRESRLRRRLNLTKDGMLDYMVKLQGFSQIRSEGSAPLAISKLLEILKLSPEEVHIELNTRINRRQIDAMVKAREQTFLLEFKANSDLAAISHAIHKLRELEGQAPNAIPLLAVRYMTDGGRKYCEDSSMSWIDLAGNARIQAPGLYIHVEGRPNVHKQTGRPGSVFAPKSSRIARWLLTHHDSYWSQRQIAEKTSMDEGFTSRIVGRLESGGYIQRNADGNIRVSNPDLMLDAWAEEYDFFKHQVYRGHMSARSSQELLQTMPSSLTKVGWQTAATGLGAAWLYNQFAGFRIVTFYLRRGPVALLPRLNEHLPGFRNDSPGANLWLVEPNDEGVFQGVESVEGVACVHPVQVWLDLKFHPERAPEAASSLRDQMPWRKRR